MDHPYRKPPPPKPITLSGIDLLVAIDALSGSLRIHGSGMFRYSEDAREEVQQTLMRILADTQYAVERIDEPEEQEKEAG